jgi:hypothetical protein
MVMNLFELFHSVIRSRGTYENTMISRPIIRMVHFFDIGTDASLLNPWMGLQSRRLGLQVGVIQWQFRAEVGSTGHATTGASRGH